MSSSFFWKKKNEKQNQSKFPYIIRILNDMLVCKTKFLHLSNLNNMYFLFCHINLIKFVLACNRKEFFKQDSFSLYDNF